MLRFLAGIHLKSHQQQMVKYFKQYSLERKSLRSSAHKDLTTAQLLEMLKEDADDPINRMVIANTVDLNARYIKKMLRSDGAY